MKKLAVFFPGIGYTVDKPLMHYCRKLTERKGYENVLLPYGNFPEKVRGDRAKMVESFELALSQAKEMLKPVKFDEYDEILFVGKSVGTIVAAAVAEKLRLPIRFVLYTPLEDTFRFDIGEAIAFSGTEDPWVGKEKSPIARICYEKHIRCVSLDNADHSLETGDLETDLEYMKLVMRMTKEFLH